MSATLYYRQISNKNKHVRVMAPSSFMRTLDEEFSGPPYRFGPTDVPVLRGMAAGFDGSVNPFRELIELIEKLTDIEVWAEY